MLVLLLCCMMKAIEFSTGKSAMAQPTPSLRGKRRRKLNRRNKPSGNKTMNEVGGLGLRGLPVSPDSDCNSNHNGSQSYLSNTSSQDIDFVQDNSDYQWFLDYGYREGGTNHHTSILSLPESYEANELNYYDALAKNMDANLAEADMESFRTKDIHALLTNLPPMCTDHLSQENNRQGESFASVSGSMMARFDFDSSASPHSSSQGEDSVNSASMSIYKSELLFSPVKETAPMPCGPNYSVDSLDCDMMLTCQANKDNYTIAFEGSTTMYSEDSNYQETDKSYDSSSTNWAAGDGRKRHYIVSNLSNIDAMSQSDSGSLTTWSNLKKGCGNNSTRRLPSGNNNNSSSEDECATSQMGLTIKNASAKSQSMPNLHKQKLRMRNALMSSLLKSQSSHTGETTTVKRRPVKVFDIQHHTHSSSASLSDMATSLDPSTANSDNQNGKSQPHFSLVKLFMKQKSMSAEGMSTTLDQLSSSENWQAGDSINSESKDPKDTSIYDNKTNESSARTNDLIAEEPDEEVSRSESVEQLSEESSVSRTESLGQEVRVNVKNNNSFVVEDDRGRKSKRVSEAAIQTSQFSEITNLKNKAPTSQASVPQYKVIEPSFLNKLKREGEVVQKPVYVLYPNYVLPNLDFLEKQEDMTKVLLVPQMAPKAAAVAKRRPFSYNDIETLKKKGFSHVQDWDSLNFLLPQEYKNILLAEVPEISEHIKTTTPFKSKARSRPISYCDYTSSSSSTATQPSSGYRGSSTILNDSSQNSPAATNLNPLFVYRYDSATSSEASSVLSSDRNKSITTTAPPLPVRCVSLPQGDQGGNVPPRPPLPRSILRKGEDVVQKRYSLYETSEEDMIDLDNKANTHKRRSLQDPYFLQMQRLKRFSETEDEGVDAGTSSSSADEYHQQELHRTSPTLRKGDFLLSNINTDELVQLEEFLKMSGVSTSDHEELNEESLMHLRSYVGKFLALKINQEGAEHFGGKKMVSFAEKVNVLPKFWEGNKQFLAPNNSPNVSAFVQHRNCLGKNLTEMTICEESESTPHSSPARNIPNKRPALTEKRSLVTAVADSVRHLVNHFSTSTSQSEFNNLGDSSTNPQCAKLALSHLCPAIYAVLSDGLKPTLESSFGAINNSVWQVVEASAQQGPLTKALNELVMRINSEDVITEGLVKFNAFVFGLLNVRSLDAWLSYLRTRESVLKKHYSKDSLLIQGQTSAEVRSLLDGLIEALQPLSLMPFQLDFLFEYRQLHLSFKRMEQLSPSHNVKSPPCFKQWTNVDHNSPSSDSILPDLLNSFTSRARSDHSTKERPRSCVEPTNNNRPNFKVGDVAKKRWSGISLNSKLYLVYDRLAKEEEDEYTDSLENGGKAEGNNFNLTLEEGPESLDSNTSDAEKPINGRRFKKLQQKWEMLSGRESQSPPQSPTHSNKSRIPRPITSPGSKPSAIPVLISPTKPKSVAVAGNKNSVKTTPVKGTACAKAGVKRVTNSARTSRADQCENETPKHTPRPSSLPYKAGNSQNGKNTKITPPRRAASSSLNRKPIEKKSMPSVVRTLSHRLPSESGHLSYNEGEKLKVVLEVDDKWLLCCRGTQKGLVPRSAVIADTGCF